MDLNRIFEDGKERLHRIQRADLKTKKRYLVFGSGFAMILVVVLWFFYLSFTLPSLAPSVETAAGSEEADNDSGESFFKVIGRGASNFKNGLVSEFGKLEESIGGGVSSFMERFRETKEFTIEPGK